MNWGILSTGGIAQKFARALPASHSGRAVAVGSRRLESAQAFSREFGIHKAYGHYGDLLRDPNVEAVYIATPHPFHLEWTLEAARAKKHILCEKPMGMNLAEVERMVAAAQDNGVVLMEAFMYRCHPQTTKLLELIREGVIGEIRMIRASFCFDRDLGLQHRLFNKSLGGGAILDLGCYPASISRLLAGVARGQAFAVPLEVKGVIHRGAESGVDEWASAVLKFPGDILAELSCAVRLDREPGFVRIYGSKGQITVPSPWHASQEAGDSKILIQPQGQDWHREAVVTGHKNIYAYEADAFAESVKKGKVEPPFMTPEDSLGNARLLDLWLNS